MRISKHVRSANEELLAASRRLLKMSTLDVADEGDELADEIEDLAERHGAAMRLSRRSPGGSSEADEARRAWLLSQAPR